MFHFCHVCLKSKYRYQITSNSTRVCGQCVQEHPGTVGILRGPYIMMTRYQWNNHTITRTIYDIHCMEPITKSFQVLLGKCMPLAPFITLMLIAKSLKYFFLSKFSFLCFPHIYANKIYNLKPHNCQYGPIRIYARNQTFHWQNFSKFCYFQLQMCTPN